MSSPTNTITTSSPLPTTMRAWTYARRGPVHSVLHLSTTHPVPPAPTSGSALLIRISHAALTPSVGRIVTPLIPPSLSYRRLDPHAVVISEADFSGVVVRAGPDAPPRLSAPGTRVWGSLPRGAMMLRGEGTMAEYALADSALVMPVPDDGNEEEVEARMAAFAGLNGNGQTALLMCRNANVGPGSRVFVNGGSGGVGTTVVQVAKALGAAEVVATGSGEEGGRLVRGMGADEVVDYRKHEPLHAYLADTYGSRPFDAFLDTIGTQALYDHSPAFLKPEGVYVNVGAMDGPFALMCSILKNTLWPRVLGGTPRKYIFQQTPLTHERIEELASLVQEGRLKRAIDHVFDMEDALQAYDRILSQRAKGKVVVKVQNI